MYEKSNHVRRIKTLAWSVTLQHPIHPIVASQPPFATNLATAELLIKALDRGDLEWREMIKKEEE